MVAERGLRVGLAGSAGPAEDVFEAAGDDDDDAL